MNRTPRTLVIMRHATAASHGTSDTARELTDRGRREAAAAGAWLAGERSFAPGRALVSAAERTRTTWALLAEAADYTLAAEFEASLQSAEAESVLDLLRLTDDSVSGLLVIGHNPTVSHLAQLLDDGEGDPAAASAMFGGYPPGAAAVYAYDGTWLDLGIGTACLEAFRPGGE